MQFIWFGIYKNDNINRLKTINESIKEITIRYVHIICQIKILN